jgi:polyhydroxybutyrate depolymerase
MIRGGLIRSGRKALAGLATAFVVLAGVLPALGQSTTTTLSFQLPGGNRTALMVDHAQGRRAPVVLVLHDENGSPEQIRRYFTWDEVGGREKLILIYPQGVRGAWNDGRPTDGRRFNPLARVDDVAFIRTLLTELDTRGRLDRRRVYVVGVGGGGHMVHRLLCEAGDLFAAGAPLLASLSIIWARSCPASAVPVVMVAGTEDRITPFAGRGSGSDPDSGMVSVPDTLTFYRARNGCTGTGERALPDQDGTDNSRITILEGTGCRHAARLYRVDGGGHHTPTRAERRMRPVVGAMLGQPNHDMETDEEIWAFFADKRRP